MEKAQENLGAIFPAEHKGAGRVIPITRPYTPSMESIKGEVEDILRSGMLTNGAHVRRFEKRVAEFLEVEEAVAVTNCTVGLIMTLRVLGLSGEILVPSFTFSATGHVCYWAGLKPVFVDCDMRDWTISLSDCAQAIGPETSAVLAVHLFGNPADIHALEEFARQRNLELIFDAAHAFGARYLGRRVGFGGRAEVFSLTPTKIVTSGEGGIICTRDRDFAQELRTFRNYGDDGSYDCSLLGLNGRMAEFNAILGLATLEHAEEEIRTRTHLAEIYRKNLDAIDGIAFQGSYRGNTPTYKDFTILIDQTHFGGTRDDLAQWLSEKGITTRKYFYPPLHLQSAYRDKGFRRSALPNTEHICRRTLSLPMFSSLTETDVEWICSEIKRFHFESLRAVRSSVPTGEQLQTRRRNELSCDGK